MLFSATAAGYPCKVLLDDSASANVISQALAQRPHLNVVASVSQVTVSTSNTIQLSAAALFQQCTYSRLA